MANSVTFPVEYGGDGKTYSDDADPTTGLDGTGYITRYVPTLKNAVAMAAWAKQKADETAADRQQTDDDRTATGQDRIAAQQARQQAESLYSDLEAVESAKDAAAASEQNAATSEQNAATSEQNSAQHEINAEAARDAAQLAAGSYADAAAGIAATASGDYFTVPDPAAPETFLVLYRNDSGAAVKVDTYPTARHIDDSVQVVYAQRAIINIIEQRLRWKYELSTDTTTGDV